jgi:hypothetical protein
MRKTFVALCLPFVVASATAGERLTAEQLESFYTDTTIFGVHFKLGPGKTYFAADGSVRSMSDGGTERVGKWWIDEGSDKRCIRWNNQNKDLCHYTERNSDGTHTLIHGKQGKKLVEIKSTEKGNHL